MADDDESKWPLLHFGPCKLKGFRKRDGLPLCQGERPEADSFLRVERRERAGLFDSLTEEGRRKTIPFHAWQNGASLHCNSECVLHLGRMLSLVITFSCMVIMVKVATPVLEQNRKFPETSARILENFGRKQVQRTQLHFLLRWLFFGVCVLFAWKIFT